MVVVPLDPPQVVVDVDLTARRAIVGESGLPSSDSLSSSSDSLFSSPDRLFVEERVVSDESLLEESLVRYRALFMEKSLLREESVSVQSSLLETSLFR